MAYSVISEKGRGGFTRVVIVEDDNGKQFAQKIYDPMDNILKAVGDEHLKRRFKREVKYQSKVMHKNVVAILDSHLDEEPPYFIMPLAACTMQDELKNGSLCAVEYKTILFDVLAGLECMHELGYVHRDLKPANILKFSGPQDWYSISDFGLMSVNESDSSTLTGSNTQGGSQNYAAPELMRNFKSATCLADIYSFGAILHDIYGNGARRIPYTELTLPSPIGNVIQKCTKINSARRYSSIAALRDDLYRVLDETEIVFSSTDEENLVEILKSENISDEQWDDVFLYLEEDVVGLGNCRNIFSAISNEHILKLLNEVPELYNALGHYFSDFIKSNSFDFDYCDILASKAEVFYEHGDLALKSSIVLALLNLGVSHNRWYVERKFLSLVGPNIDEKLANRIVTEIEVEDVDFENLIARLESSISATRDSLHPILQFFLVGND
jgi:serine/threonine protein kinase